MNEGRLLALKSIPQFFSPFLQHALHVREVLDAILVNRDPHEPGDAAEDDRHPDDGLGDAVMRAGGIEETDEKTTDIYWI
jgi:hypothetical protein